MSNPPGFLRTSLCDRLGIEVPIVCGGMTATGSAELAAGVSNAGGLGMLTCLHCRTPEGLREEIARCRKLTDKPFAVNLTILGEKRGAPEYPAEFAQVITSSGIKIVETCGGTVSLMQKLHQQLRDGGVTTIISKCVQVKHALVAQDKLGSDVIALMGNDSGGLPGEVDMGVFVQMALAKRSLKIPFLASGGVATGEQLVAALALGASGVQIGTAFNTTKECVKFPEAFKQRMIEADAKATGIVMRPMRGSSRVILNGDARAILKIEKEKGANIAFGDVAEYVMFDRLREGMANNDPDRGIWNCGQSVVLVNEVTTCKELVDRIMREAQDTMQNRLLPISSAL
mmetsp:Transcript_21531/g.38036  ORF Transcript_21531/g.38036 Transcript_21531/m.38036 type:complete len:343 (-) Transcript_21531:129-1157(-)